LIADGIVRENDKYSLLFNNCQHFALKLYKRIVASGKGGDDGSDPESILENILGPELRPSPEAKEKIDKSIAEVDVALKEGQLSSFEDYVNAYAFQVYAEKQAKEE